MAVSQLPGFTPQRFDEVLIKIENAFNRVEACSGSVVSRKAELDLLAHLEVARNFMMSILQSSDRTLLSAIFGGDCSRITRLRVVVDGVKFSEMNAGDQRLQGCLRACASVEQVLEDLGLGMVLRKAREEEKRHSMKACTQTEAGADEHVPGRCNGLEDLTCNQSDVMIFRIDSQSDGEDSEGDSSNESSGGGWHENSNAERHKQDLDLLLHQRRLQARTMRSGGPAEVTPQPAQEQTLSPSQDQCVKFVVSSLIAENTAFDLDRSGKARRAIKQYRRCELYLKDAIAAAEPKHSVDKPKLEAHQQDVQARIKYLWGLDPIGRPPPIPLQQHVHPWTLEMQLPPIKFVRAGDASPAPETDWKTSAACAALGAAGGFVVLGGAAALSAVGIVGSLAASAAAGTGGVLGSVAGAAAGTHCAARQDSIGAAARKAGNATAKKVEKVGNTAVHNAEQFDSHYGLSQMVSQSIGVVSEQAAATAKKMSGQVSSALKRSPSLKAIMTWTPQASAGASEAANNTSAQQLLKAECQGDAQGQGKKGLRRRASSAAANGKKTTRRSTAGAAMCDNVVAGGSSGSTAPASASLPSAPLFLEEPAASAISSQQNSRLRGNSQRRSSQRVRPRASSVAAGQASSKRGSSSFVVPNHPPSKQQTELEAAEFLQSLQPESKFVMDSGGMHGPEAVGATDMQGRVAAPARRRRPSQAAARRQSQKVQGKVRKEFDSDTQDFFAGMETTPLEQASGLCEGSLADVRAQPVGDLSFPRSSPLSSTFDFGVLDTALAEVEDWMDVGDQDPDVKEWRKTRQVAKTGRRASSAAAVGRGRKSVRKSQVAAAGKPTSGPSSEAPVVTDSFL